MPNGGAWVAARVRARGERASALQDETQQTVKFVVGLGNPGSRYAGTRHNVGFRVLDVLCERWGAGPGRSAFRGTVYEARPRRGDDSERRVFFLAPQTYMNRSGQAARELVQFYKASPRDVLVVLDDMTLPLGQLRARADGTAGGHNGLADVLAQLGTDEVPRLRLGIGSPPASWDAVDYVLATFRDDEVETMKTAIQFAADAVEDWVFDGITGVMNKYNRKPEG